MSIQRYSRGELLCLYLQWHGGNFNEAEFQEWLLDEEFYQIEDSRYYEKFEDV